QLAYLGHALQLKIIRECGVPAYVGKNGQSASCDYGAPDSQTVEAVGQVHGIAGSHDHKSDEDDEWQERDRPQVRIVEQRLEHQVRTQRLDERNDQVRGVQATGLHRHQHNCYQDREQELKHQFAAARQPQISTVHKLRV